MATVTYACMLCTEEATHHCAVKNCGQHLHGGYCQQHADEAPRWHGHLLCHDCLREAWDGQQLPIEGQPGSLGGKPLKSTDPLKRVAMALLKGRSGCSKVTNVRQLKDGRFMGDCLISAGRGRGAGFSYRGTYLVQPAQ